MPKPKATPAQVRAVLIEAGCVRPHIGDNGREFVANASAAADKLGVTAAYVARLLLPPSEQQHIPISLAKLREHAATLGLAPERIDQILPLNDETTTS